MEAGRAQQPTGIDRILIPGILAGMVASVPMGLIALIASATVHDRGFFTPVYLVTSLVGDDALARSLREAAQGDLFFVEIEPLVFGSAIHLLLASFFGAVFALIAQRVPKRLTLPASVAYALVVMVIMVFIVVPLADIALQGPRAMEGFVSQAGFWTLLSQHIVFGVVVGSWPWLRPRPLKQRLRAPSSFRTP
jgi:hypothetical protein